MELRLYRLTVVLAALGFLTFATLAGMAAKDYFTHMSSMRGWSELRERDEQDRQVKVVDFSTLKPFPANASLDDPSPRFDWGKMESESRSMAAAAENQLIEFLMASVYIPAIIFVFFYSARWIMTGKLTPWIPK